MNKMEILTLVGIVISLFNFIAIMLISWIANRIKKEHFNETKKIEKFRMTRDLQLHIIKSFIKKVDELISMKEILNLEAKAIEKRIFSLEIVLDQFFNSYKTYFKPEDVNLDSFNKLKKMYDEGEDIDMKLIRKILAETQIEIETFIDKLYEKANGDLIKI